MKKILGLDIGTNSIGAALINLPEKFEDYGKQGNIEWMGSRIIPMNGDYLAKFEGGISSQSDTKAAARRQKRGSRRLKHRYKLRRTRLIKVFKALGWIDENFPLDDSRAFKRKLREDGSFKFSISSYLPFSEKTIGEFKKEMGIDGKKRIDKKKGKEVDFLLPEDWVIYFLRKKALTEKIEMSELCRIIYMMNQRRGFKSSRKDLKDTNLLPYNDFISVKQGKDHLNNVVETQFVSITKIKSVIFKEDKKDRKGNVIGVYTIVPEDMRMYSWEETRRQKPDWEGKEFTFLVSQKIDKNGILVQNKPQIPKEDNWGLCTTALDERINEHTYPGKYFFDELKKAFKENRNFKIRQYPVYRWRYQKELEEIWRKQCELNPDLASLNKDEDTLTRLASILYPAQAKNNMAKFAEFKNNDILHIISNDIIYYQRELKSQKNSIGECRYEKHKGVDGEMYGLKCTPRSSPLFQEFRIWQDIHNIRILEREVRVEGKTYLDVDVTANFVNELIKERLFDMFSSKNSVSEKDILELLKANYPHSTIRIDLNKKENQHSHRVNLFANREELKGNEIINRYRKIFKSIGFDGDHILTEKDKLNRLWHIDYSISSSDDAISEKGIMTALGWTKENDIWIRNKKWPIFEMPKDVALAITKLPELKKEYGSFSAKAIKKMLPVMRCGSRYWDATAISEEVKKRAGEIGERLNDINHSYRRIAEIADDDVQKQVLKSFIGKEDLTKGLNTYQAGYLIYDKHSEKDKKFVQTAEDFGTFIQKEVANNSLRNPIVEQVVRETMFLVRDIWKRYGEINELHIEVGRDLKNNADERKKISDIQKANFDEKQRTKILLYELINEGFDQYIDSEESQPFDWKTEIETETTFEVKPNPENPGDVEKFLIWKSLSRFSDTDWDKKVKDEKIATEQQVKKYTLWMSQNCRSPYTGKIIPLSKLFDGNQYEIEHIIPRRKMKNDSFNNLVIAEWGVNKAKDNQLAANFIAGCKGKCIHGNKEYQLFTYDQYDVYCRETFKFQKNKRKNLLATEVPEDFIDRQINDTRYIGRKLSELLAPVVKTVGGQLSESGIIFTIGSITSELKGNWGLNGVWKDLLRPRFERLEKITGKKFVLTDENDPNKYHFDLTENPALELKRIDHRHHALDALIIAATTREHIRYLNTLSASDSDEDFNRYRRTLVKGKIREFLEPWPNFAKNAKEKLEEIIITFKTNNKIISKPKNKYAKWILEDGKPIKKSVEQKPNPRWMAVRKSMFKEPQGIVYLKEVYEEKSILRAFEIQIDRMLAQNTPAMQTAAYIYDQEARKIMVNLIKKIGISIYDKQALLNEIKNYFKRNKLKNLSGLEYQFIAVAKFEEYAAKRVALDKSFDHKKIDKIPYAKVGKSVLGHLLHDHLDAKEFEGKPELAFSGEGLESLSKKAGRQINKVTIAEKKDESSKFGRQYVEVDAGANAFFVMYESQITGERVGYQSIPAHKAIERLTDRTKKGIIDTKNGYNTIILSPDDLVYLPTEEEVKKLNEKQIQPINWNDKKRVAERIYKVNSCTGSKCEFVPHRFVNNNPIIDKIEFGANNINQRAWDGTVKLTPSKNDGFTRDDSGTMIKDICIKIVTDRLGNIKHVL